MNSIYAIAFLSQDHMNPQLTCSQRQWLHSSVGKASHRYRKVTGSNPRWGPEFFFQASLSNCINCVHCDDHFFIFIFQSTICCFRKRWQQNLPEKKKKWAQTKKTKDSQLVFHAFHLPKQPFKAIIVSSEETDVRLLCLAFSNIINVPIFQSMRFTISRLVHWH